MQNIPQKNLWDISYLYRNDEKRFVLFFDGYFFCSTPCSTDLFAIRVFTESPYSYIIGFSFFQSFDCYAVLFDFYIFRTLHGFFQGILHLISFCTSYFFNGNDCFSGFFTLYRFHSCFLCCHFCCLKIFLCCFYFCFCFCNLCIFCCILFLQFFQIFLCFFILAISLDCIMTFRLLIALFCTSPRQILLFSL